MKKRLSTIGFYLFVFAWFGLGFLQCVDEDVTDRSNPNATVLQKLGLSE